MAPLCDGVDAAVSHAGNMQGQRGYWVWQIRVCLEGGRKQSREKKGGWRVEDGGWERIRNQATRHEPAQTVVYATKSCVMCKRTKAQREITKVKSRSKKERKKERKNRIQS